MPEDAAPLHRALGLTDDEAADIDRILGRPANHLELAMFSVMWSEHCSYKSSSVHLKRLPTTGEAVLVGPGEGAGVLDVGDGIAAAIRIESHNHPSAIEPYQGAATGAGGILRDIFSVGARPIALMDPLRVGPLDEAVEDLHRPGVLEVQRDRLLAPVGAERDVRGVPEVVPQRVHLDDRGAEVGQHLGAPRPGDGQAEVEHHDAVERPPQVAGRGRRSSSPAIPSREGAQAPGGSRSDRSPTSCSRSTRTRTSSGGTGSCAARAGSGSRRAPA